MLVKSITPLSEIQDTTGIESAESFNLKFEKSDNSFYYYVFDLEQFQDTLNGEYDPAVSFAELLAVLGFENAVYTVGVSSFPKLYIVWSDLSHDCLSEASFKLCCQLLGIVCN